MNKFNHGDNVFKPKGYAFRGVVLAVFPNTRGEIKVAVELVNKMPFGVGGNGDGMIHIFSENQLELI
jgi:hypothetical protein